MQGAQDDPYMPDNADAEYRLLADRAITNVMPFVVGTPAQEMYVDSFRRGSEHDEELDETDTDEVQVEWDHWQKSRLDARQSAIYRGALTFGHSFAVTERVKGVLKTKGLSALKTTALYEDPANDDEPYAALTVIRFPTGSAKEKNFVPGKAYLWDSTHKYQVGFKSLQETTKGITVKSLGRHGADECPITRFAAAVDLEGRTCGIVEPLIPLQNRLNQTIFDMLVVQSYASFKVRTISGMAPPVKMKPIDVDGAEVRNPSQNEDKIVEWIPRVNPTTGMPIPDEVNLNARRVFWAEHEDTKFGSLDETPLDGFIEAIKLGFQHITALSQTPPHHLLGQIANLSAEALEAAETALSRKVEEFQYGFGESWERVFRIAAQIEEVEGAEDYSGEVIWRDLGNRAMGQVGDALSKFRNDLGVPARGLWNRIPNVTATELKHWRKLAEEENADLAVADAARRSTASAASGRPDYRVGPAQTRRQAVDAA